MPFVPNRSCDNVRLTQKQDCRMATCWDSGLFDGHDDSGAGRGGLAQGGRTTEPPRLSHCALEPAPGACKTTNEQWFYNATEATCARFLYTGCGGNMNNFDSKQECLTACHPGHAGRQFRGLQAESLVREEWLPQQDQPAASAACLASPWSAWSACSASCGRGWLTQARTILRQPTGGGRPCPRKLQKRKRCSAAVPCSASPPTWYQGNFRMLESGSDN